jgi:hypothetical protein
MAKLYRDNVSIVLNPKGEIALKKNEKGAFSAADAAKIAKKMRELSTKHKAPISQWAMFVAPGADELQPPILLANKFGQPYLAWLPPSAPKPSKKGPTILA